MNVRLVSCDQHLHGLCRDIQEAIPGCHWQLVTGEAQEAPAGTDLYIWDFDRDVGIRAALRNDPMRHLFLVDRRDLAAFQACIGRADVPVLLKPVTRSTLAAFLGLAVSAHEESDLRSTGIRAERDAMLQCLIQANLKLQEFDHDRTNFLARALHDFRSPLTAICGYCDLLLEDVLGPLPDEQKDVIGRMKRSTQRLSQMASAMYELSVGPNVPLPLDRREADIEDCIDRALEEAHAAASAKAILITTEIDAAPGALFCDSAAIEQVLVYLLENACKFTPKGGTVVLAAYPYFWERRRTNAPPSLSGDRRRQQSVQANSYRIDIVNPGFRIPDQHLHTMFEEYASYAGGQDRSGGGLGLAICKMNIARQNGRIWAENRDAGPAFSIVLPLRTAKAAIFGPLGNSEAHSEH
jgi:signal transduction histidine kinase